MAPVTIGDQKFIKDLNKGWIDSKTKQPADKALIRLLDSLVIDEPVLKKLRVKIDRNVEPVFLNGQKFVYDVNQGWIDEKTKVPVPPSLQRVLSNSVPRFGKNDSPDIDLTAGFGMVGQAGLQQTKAKPATEKTGGGRLEYTNKNLNKPIIKMIGALASIDGFLKQRLDNQKVIAKNNLLASRESQIEGVTQTPEMQVIQQDAERVSGPSAGLMAIGGLALLTLDPVQEAMKSIVSGVVETGKFITGVVSTINKAFTFLFSSTGTDPTAVAPTTESGTQATPAAPSDTSISAAAETPDAQPAPVQETPSFFSSVAAGASTGAVVGSVVPRVGMVAGAVAGGAIAAVSHFTSGGSTTPATSGSTSSGTPQATPVSSGTESNAEPVGADAGSIPKNNIVALGNYLVGKGAERGKLEHPAFGSVGTHSQNSRHYRGQAIDVNFPGPNEGAILDSLEPQLRAAGYNTIWRKPGHYTHMHVSTGGPEGAGGGTYGDSDTLMGMAANAVNMGAEKIGELFGMLGSAIIKPGVPRDKEDYSKAIAAAAVQTNTEAAVAKTPKQKPTPPAPKPPNINRSDIGAPQNPATAADKNSVYYYLRRFGFQELSTPSKALLV